MSLILQSITAHSPRKSGRPLVYPGILTLSEIETSPKKVRSGRDGPEREPGARLS